MIATFLLTVAPLIDLFQNARGDLLISTPSIASARVTRAIGVAARNGATVRVLLAPQVQIPDDELNPLVGRDPFAASAEEFAWLKQARADVFIDPRFSQAGANSLHLERGSSASFIVGKKRGSSESFAVVCTGPISDVAMREHRNVCAKTAAAEVHQALTNLHSAAFHDTLPDEKRKWLEKSAKAALVVTPGDSAKLRDLIADAGKVRIALGRISTQNELFDAIKNGASKVTLFVPLASRESDAALHRLEKQGVTIVRTPLPFSGSLVAAETRLFIGSQAWEPNERFHRGVGVVLPIGTESIQMPGDAR